VSVDPSAIPLEDDGGSHQVAIVLGIAASKSVGAEAAARMNRTR
jgi:hypothetical protein